MTKEGWKIRGIKTGRVKSQEKRRENEKTVNPKGEAVKKQTFPHEKISSFNSEGLKRPMIFHEKVLWMRSGLMKKKIDTYKQIFCCFGMKTHCIVFTFILFVPPHHIVYVRKNLIFSSVSTEDSLLSEAIT